MALVKFANAHDIARPPNCNIARLPLKLPALEDFDSLLLKLNLQIHAQEAQSLRKIKPGSLIMMFRCNKMKIVLMLL